LSSGRDKSAGVTLQLKLGKIKHDREGHEAIVNLYASARDCEFDEIGIDMSGCRWFDADMCAGFGAVLYSLGADLNTIRIFGLASDVEQILSKNGFLSTYGRSKLPDRWGTTIPYQRFDSKDDRFFGKYVENELMSRSQLPKMSKGLAKKFRESVFEIFSNAVIHSQTKLGIFCCGQFFPGRHRIDFCVADLGIGIRENVELSLGKKMDAPAAIAWATEGRNTTKRGPIPGGLGLKLLREFIGLNGGQIQIVSDAGYWCQKGTETNLHQLSAPFPGTVVNVEINTADKCSYVLASELSSDEIF
jgi:hypothetical protein